MVADYLYFDSRNKFSFNCHFISCKSIKIRLCLILQSHVNPNLEKRNQNINLWFQTQDAGFQNSDLLLTSTTLKVIERYN